jgi:hypothetical protein
MRYVVVGNTILDQENNLSKVLFIGTLDECEDFVNETPNLNREFSEVAMVDIEEFASTSTMIQ